MGAALFFTLAVASAASAHALPASADPAPDSVLRTSPQSVTITFTEEVDPKLSWIVVSDDAGVPLSGPTSAVAGRPDELSTTVETLPDGVYWVSWRTLALDDGHVAEGSYSFSVDEAGSGAFVAGGGAASLTGAATGGLVVSVGPSPGVVVSRWILYLGLMGLVGAAFLATVAWHGGLSGGSRGGETRSTLTLAIVELGVALTGSVLLVAFQIGDAGVSLGDAAGSSLGRDAFLRLAPLVVASGLLGAATDAPARIRSVLLAAAGVMAALALLVEAFLSHASAQPMAAAEVVVQWLHMVAVGLWLGGLVFLISQVRGTATPEKGELARRFASLAGCGLAIVILTGVLRAIVDIGTLDALFSTDFGRLVLVKAGLLAAIAALGAVNHFYTVARAGRRLAPLRRVGSLELALGAIVLLVASMLVNVAPPSEVQAVSAQTVGASAAPSPANLSSEADPTSGQ
jgi:copper transport protein